MKISLFFQFLCQIVLISSLDIYIVPYNSSSPCQISKICNGSFSNPFDDLSYAFHYGMSNSLGESSMNFNLITTSNIPFYINSTGITLSPFDNFTGNLLIHGINLNNFSDNAKIWLKTDNIIFQTQGSLSLINLTIVGIDMHIESVICQNRPNNSTCSCLNSTSYNDSILYVTNSVCSIQKSTINAQPNVFAGFIKIVGTLNSSLFIQDLIILNFNSFVNHITFIYAKSPTCNINIMNLTVNQGYFPKSFISIQSNSLTMNINMLKLFKINEYFASDSRSNKAIFLQFSSSKGLITLNNIQITMKWLFSTIEILQFSQSSLILNVNGFSVQPSLQNTQVGNLVIFEVIQTPPYNNTLNVNNMSIGGSSVIFSIDSNTIFNLTNSNFTTAINSKTLGNILGSNSISYNSNNIYTYYCDIVLSADNSTIYLNNSIATQLKGNLAVFNCLRGNIFVSNYTLDNIAYAAFQNNNNKVNSFNYLEIENFIMISAKCSSACFLLTYTGAYIIIRNSRINNLYSIGGTSGAIILAGLNNVLFAYNFTVNNSTSPGYGAAFASFQSSNNTAIFRNCIFMNIYSISSKNMYIILTTLIMENCSFYNLTSPITAFIYSQNSTILLNNTKFELALTMNQNLIDLTLSNFTIINGNFSNLIGGIAVLFSAKVSKIVIERCNFSNLTSSISSMVSSGCTISIINTLFFNISEGIFMQMESNNNVSIINSEFMKISMNANNFFVMKNQNFFQIIFSFFSNISIILQGAFLKANEINSIILDNTRLISVTAAGIGAINVFQSSFLLLKNISFINVRSQISGELIWATMASIMIHDSIFENSSSTNGGILYLNFTTFLMNFTIFNNFYSDVTNNAITAMNSNVSINSCQFSNIQSVIASVSNIMDNLLLGIFVNFIFINNSSFINNSDSLNYMFFIQGVGNISINTSFFVNNVYYGILQLQNSGFFIQNLSFINNTANIMILVFNNILGLTALKANMNTSNFFGNNVNMNFLLIEGIYQFYLNSIVIKLNNKTSNNPFISLQNVNIAKFVNIACFNNSLFSGKEFMFQCSNVGDFLMNNANFTSNHMQLIQIYMSNVVLSLIKSQYNSIYSFISSQQSNLTISDSFFQGFNPLSVNFCKDLSCNTTIFYISHSNCILSNVIFENIQNQENFSQIEIEIFDSFLLSLTNVSFKNDVSYSIYAYNVSNISFSYCTFQIDDKQGNINSGLIQIENLDNITYNLMIFHSYFENLGSLNSKSALYYDNTNENSRFTRILIKYCFFTNNSAFKGGAISFRGLTNTTIEDSSFIGNEALATVDGSDIAGVGGSIYSGCALPNACNITFKNSTIQRNQANFLGGGIFLQNYTITKQEDLVLSENFANFVYNSYNSSPFYINISHIRYSEVYENEVYFSENDQFDKISIINNQNLELKFAIYDSDNFICDYQMNANAILTAFDLSITLQDTNTAVEKGIILFNKFKIKGKFKESYIIQMEIKGKFYLKKNFTFYIRECDIGEYFDKSYQSCFICPSGSYSLEIPNIISNEPFQQEEITICKNCPKNTDCKAWKIAPFSNFWMNSSNFTTLAIECPLSSCIYQDFDTFNFSVPCNIGYMGPLCVECANGYAKDGFTSECNKCLFGTKEFFIYFGKLLYIVLLVSYSINKTISSSASSYEESSKVSAVIIKILRDHFNQIFMIFAFCGIFQFEGNYFTTFQNINQVVTGSSLNFDCFRDENTMDLLYFKVLMVMISPFILHAVVSFFYILYYFIKRFILKKSVYIKYCLKTLLIAFIIICDTLYTQILMSFLKLFECTQIDSNNNNLYLRFAPHIQCYTGTHINYLLGLGLPCLIIWILGLPITFFVVLYILNRKLTTTESKNLSRNVKSHSKSMLYSKVLRQSQAVKQNLEDSKSKSESKKGYSLGIFESDMDIVIMMSFLFMDYKEDKYYWSSVIMIWKAILSILVTFIIGENIYAITLTFYCLLLLIYSYGSPYNNTSTKYLVLFSLSCNAISIVLAEFNYSKNGYINSIVIINLLLHLAFFIMVAIVFVKEYGLSVIIDFVLKILSKKKNNKKIVSLMNSISKYRARKSNVSDSHTNINQTTNSPLFPIQSPVFLHQSSNKIKKNEPEVMQTDMIVDKKLLKNQLNINEIQKQDTILNELIMSEIPNEKEDL